METWEILLAAAGAVVVALIMALVVRRRGRARVATAAAPAIGPRERLRNGLLATRRQLAAILSGGTPSDGVFPSLEEALVAADVGVRTAADLVERVRGRLGAPADGSAVRHALREEIGALLSRPVPVASHDRPYVILVTGVNGVGKTTTIGKLAAQHTAAGRRVLLVAGDTFRAAAGDQLR